MAFDRPGSNYITTSGLVGISGDPKTIYAIHIVSGAIAGVVTLRNGTDATGTVYVQEPGVSNLGKTILFGKGFNFPGGCYASLDANVTSVLVSFSEWKV